jgi:hypothetical protein
MIEFHIMLMLLFECSTAHTCQNPPTINDVGVSIPYFLLILLLFTSVLQSEWLIVYNFNIKSATFVISIPITSRYNEYKLKEEIM